jgi:very-short-patch-repair endonuclease
MNTVPLQAEIAREARHHHGLITIEELHGLEVSSRRAHLWVKAGRLDLVLPGVFRIAGAPESREQSFAAAVLWAGASAALSHRAAGELWGFDIGRAARPEVTVPWTVSRETPGVVVHRTRAAIPRGTRKGITVTTPERTVIDLARSLTAEQLEIAFESARHERLVTVAFVERALERVGSRGRRGSDALRALLRALTDEPAAESALEALVARVLRASDLPKPQRQVDVAAFDRRYRLDFAWPEQLVALECDGQKWHGDFERDRKRWSAISAATGYRIVWATWKRVHDEPERLVDELRLLLCRRA